jgi:hypothetical protein
VIRPDEHIAAQWLAGPGGVLQFATSSRSMTSQDEYDIFYRRLDPQPATGMPDQALAFEVVGNRAPLPDTWYHFALRYDGTLPANQLSLLIDGELEAQGDASGIFSGEQGPYGFGNRFGNPQEDFRGDVDEIRFWNAALPDVSIRSRFQSRLTGDEENLVAYYPLDGHTRDASGSQPDGVLACRESYAPGVALSNCAPLPAGLVSWWKGEDDFLDRTGANHASGMGGAGFAEGLVGRAFDLDGSNGFVQVAAPVGLPLGNAPRTLMQWCKTPRNLMTCTESGLAQYGTVSPGQMFGLITSSNAPARAYFYDAAANLAGVRTLLPETWYHIAVSYDGSMLRLFLDGQLESRVARTLNTVLDGNGLTFGSRPGSQKWQGQLDEIMIFNRALEPTEIFSVHAAGAAGCSGCVPPVVPPLTVVQGNGDLQISWPSLPGQRYRIESSTTLEPDGWELEGSYLGTGEVLGVNFPTGPEPRKFFRLSVIE